MGPVEGSFAMKVSFVAVLLILLSGLALMGGTKGDPGSTPGIASDYKVLEPISHGDLTIFPVVSSKVHDTSEFLTLDEGIRSGEVVVTEVGNLHSTMRRRPYVPQRGGAEVNRLVLVEVGKSRGEMAAKASAAAPVAGGGDTEYAYSVQQLNNTTSYAKARENKVVQAQVDSIVEPMQKSYESVIKQLRNQNAVGVVVAVKGRIVWADMFASGALLGKYWPKLLDSYATEAMTASGARGEVSIKDAQGFLDNWQARHEVVDSEPGLYRQRELIGDRFKAFELTWLLAKAPFDVHLSKMAD
jgi:hypothetical protein